VQARVRRWGPRITQTLQNTSNTAQKVTYRITPHAIDNNDNNKCPYGSIDIDVWVEPTVVITAVNDTICNNTATSIFTGKPPDHDQRDKVYMDSSS